MKHLIIALILTGSIAVLNTPIAEAITGTTSEVMPESSQGAATQEVLDEAALDGPKAGVDESGNVEGEVTNIFTEADTDGDGIPDSQDPDADGDGTPNAEDWYPFNPLFDEEGEYDSTAVPLENLPDLTAEPPSPDTEARQTREAELAAEGDLEEEPQPNPSNW